MWPFFKYFNGNLVKPIIAPQRIAINSHLDKYFSKKKKKKGLNPI